MELLLEAGANVDVPKEVSVTSCTHISETMHQVITIAIELPPHHVLVISVVLVHWTLVVCGGPELVDCPVCVETS